MGAMQTIYTFTAVFLGIVLFSVTSAAFRRDFQAGVRAVIYAGPAAVAWAWYAWYETTMPAEMNIRIDIPILWMFLLMVSLPAGLYVIGTFVEIVGRLLAGSRNDRVLRSWQNPKDPLA